MDSSQLPKSNFEQNSNTYTDSVLNKKEANKKSRLTKASSGLKSSNSLIKKEPNAKEEWSMTAEEEKGVNIHQNASF